VKEIIEIDSVKKVKAYLTMPESKPKGGIIVIHEVWGLDDHIKSVADRFANEGYVAIAPELLDNSEFSSEEIARLQRSIFDENERNKVQPQLRKLMAPMQEPQFGDVTIKRLKSVFDYIYSVKKANKNISVIGFCFGGSYSYALATVESRLKLSLPFYGHSDQTIDELVKINCPVRAFYGQNDLRLISGIDDLKERMKSAKVDYKVKIYENCGHAFFNDSNPGAYNKAAATDAWNRVLVELGKIR